MSKFYSADFPMWGSVVPGLSVITGFFAWPVSFDPPQPPSAPVDPLPLSGPDEDLEADILTQPFEDSDMTQPMGPDSEDDLHWPPPLDTGAEDPPEEEEKVQAAPAPTVTFKTVAAIQRPEPARTIAFRYVF
jgi:hypothetical protein